MEPSEDQEARRAEAVRRVLAGEKQTAVAAELNLPLSTLNRWVKAARDAKAAQAAKETTAAFERALAAIPAPVSTSSESDETESRSAALLDTCQKIHDAVDGLLSPVNPKPLAANMLKACADTIKILIEIERGQTAPRSRQDEVGLLLQLLGRSDAGIELEDSE